MAALLCCLLAVSAAHAQFAELLPPFLTENLDDLVRVASQTCEALPLEILFSRQQTLELPLLNVIEYSRVGSRRIPVRLAHKILRPPHQSSLVFYIPGWWNTPYDDSTREIVSSLLEHHETVALVDTQYSFRRGYLGSASRVHALANMMQNVLAGLMHEGVPPEAVQIVGFSLGAHVAGLASRMLKQKYGRKVARVTALDPAQPCFARSLFRLSKRDADFVQVVHTSSLGFSRPLGHADVYVNGVEGGQPECTNKRISIECDHSMAWKFYAQSARFPGTVMGRKCTQWSDLKEGRCSGNETVVGYGCSAKNRGLFLYLSQQERDFEPKNKFRSFNVFDPLFWFS